MKIFNSLSKKKEELKTIKEDELGIYVCGVTIYDKLHLGHARTFTAFDVNIRYLESIGYKVKFVRNITDIDDKIINRAKELGVQPKELTIKYECLMKKNFESLNLKVPDVEPRVSEHIEEIIEMIIVLLDKGFAYKSLNGDVLFNISKRKNYGILSGQIIENIGSNFNERNLIKEQVKENENDFVLWKSTNDKLSSYSSPFGIGRPGWHIECSAMAKKHLGSNFDIHGGGKDLTFPHHENEIAQSTCANGTDYANLWMHTGMITVDGVKMSKSLGNFITIDDILEKYDPEAVRLFLLSSHYRSNMDYSLSSIEQAEKTLERVYGALERTDTGRYFIFEEDTIKRFNEAMMDDFNTPLSLSIIYDAVKDLNKANEKNDLPQIKKLHESIKKMGNILGLFTRNPKEYFESKMPDSIDTDFLIKQRDLARENKDFDEADRIRDLLTEMNYSINDKKI
jgi:cysteinyl-tRNA synthetase